jgi:hypothetical protein
MKQKVTIPHILSGATTATIIINKDGMSVIDKNEHCSDSSVVKGFLTRLIDMDEWNHSWHLSVSNAQFKSSDERKRVREILQEKIEQREKEIQELKNGIQVLGRWNLNTK